jgi:hypothetical protein
MPRQPKRATTCEALDLDIRELARVKNFREGLAKFEATWTYWLTKSSVGVTVLGSECALVSYSDTRGEAITERIGIEWTPCNYGGARPWWSCPQCDRRCVIVYARGARPFMCRLCADLTYETAQSDAPTHRQRLEGRPSARGPGSRGGRGTPWRGLRLLLRVGLSGPSGTHSGTLLSE